MLVNKKIKELLKTPELEEFLDLITHEYQKEYQRDTTFDLYKLNQNIWLCKKPDENIARLIELEKTFRQGRNYINSFNIVLETLYLKDSCSFTHSHKTWNANFKYKDIVPPSITTLDIEKVFDKDLIQQKVYTAFNLNLEPGKFYTIIKIVENIHRVTSNTGSNINHYTSIFRQTIHEIRRACIWLEKNNICEKKSSSGLPTEYSIK